MARDIPSTVQEFFSTSDIPLALSDPRLPDDPLILANDAFYRMTGFNESEALGSNCRFMQGKGTQKSARNTIRGNFAASRDTKVLIRNYRKSGEAFDNYLYIFNVMDKNDKPIYRIGSQFEVPHFDRSSAFTAHIDYLRSGLEAVNKTTDVARQQLVNTGDLIGMTVKALLMARLDNLKTS